MSAIPAGVDLSDARAAAYFGGPKVTPAREQAWSQWKDDYFASVITRWAEQGSTREEMFEPLCGIVAEFDQVDGLEWMAPGRAMSWRIGSIISSGQPLEGEKRLDYLNSLRTSETSPEDERILVCAYHLGISTAQATKLAQGSDSFRRRVVDGAGETALYRYFDIDGTLLYVGIANDPGDRDAQHRYHSEWYRFQAHRDVEWFDTREAATGAEREAIGVERPLFNRTHNGQMRNAAIDYLFGALKQPVKKSKGKQVAS